MAEKTILDGIILKIDNGYPLLQVEYKTLLEELPVVSEEESVGSWDSGTIDYRNVIKKILCSRKFRERIFLVLSRQK